MAARRRGRTVHGVVLKTAADGYKQPRSERVKRGKPIPLATWHWFLAALFYPYGMCIAAAAANLWRWPVAIVTAVLTCVATWGGIVLLVLSEPGDFLLRTVVLAGLVLECLVVGQLVYSFGRRKNYWKALGTRVWQLYGYAGLFAFFALLLLMMFVFFAGPIMNAISGW